MAELKPCPFCGGEARMQTPNMHRVTHICCKKCLAGTKWGLVEEVEELWNQRYEPPKVETLLFDKEEIHEHCVVQVLTNTVTGQQSVGWWPEDAPP